MQPVIPHHPVGAGGAHGPTAADGLPPVNTAHSPGIHPAGHPPAEHHPVTYFSAHTVPHPDPHAVPHPTAHATPHPVAPPVAHTPVHSPAAHAPTEENPATQIAHLQEQLQAKEQLVVALTDRLEQAAEQLDRVRRTGGDRALRRTAGGMPPELVEEQRSAIDELKQSLARWEEMQAGMTLGRIETQIAELRDLVVNNVPSGSPTRDSGSSSQRGREQPSSTSWWEQQKAALLGDAPAPTATHSSTPDHSRATISEIKYEAEGTTTTGSLQIPDAPAPLDYENLVLDEARHALQERDNIIAQLREQLLLVQAQSDFAGYDLNSPDLPAGMKERLELLEQQWQAKFRQVELDLSIERARYAREEANLQARQELIEKEMLRLGLQGRDVKGGRGEPENVPRRRWFNFLNNDAEGAHE